MHQISVNLDKDSLRKIRVEAEQSGRAQSEVIRDWLEKGRLVSLKENLKMSAYAIANTSMSVLVVAWSFGI